MPVVLNCQRKRARKTIALYTGKSFSIGGYPVPSIGECGAVYERGNGSFYNARIFRFLVASSLLHALFMDSENSGYSFVRSLFTVLFRDSQNSLSSWFTRAFLPFPCPFNRHPPPRARDTMQVISVDPLTPHFDRVGERVPIRSSF